MIYKKLLLSLLGLLISLWNIAQDINLDSLLDSEMDKKNQSETQYTEATFKSSQLINSHTVETTQKGVLDFKISHRFATIDQGFYKLFGLDDATSMRFGANYGITNRFTVGAGRSSFEKEYDAFLKYKIFWQSTGKQSMPVSLSLLSSVMLKTQKNPLEESNSDTSFLAFQAILARKFSSNFSLQVLPTVIRNNKLATNYYSIGAGARFKLTKRSGITGEYYYQLPDNKLIGTYNSFSLGYEVETGGHVFQFTLSNSAGITERTFITETHKKWEVSNLHFGFNISRVFTLKKQKNLTDNDNHAAPRVTETKKEEAEGNKTEYAQATFKTSRLINGHTVETTQKGVLDVKVTHRFGKLNDGFYNLFGLDAASMRMGVDYGINDRFTIGVGRSTSGKNVLDTPTLEKEYDGFVKYKLLSQSTGQRTMPVTVTVLSSAIVNTLKEQRLIVNPVDTLNSKSINIQTSDRLYYAFQALIARRFSDGFSLQLMPTMVHYNIVENSSISNDLYSLGIAARFKLTQRSSFNVEYYYRLSGSKLPNANNSFSLGYEIETGGHVFQLQLSNSYGMTERTFINETRGTWHNGDIHFGFNISRVFVIKKPKNI